MDPDDEEAPPQTPQSDDHNHDLTALQPSFPLGRVKKIVKLDRDIKKLNSEALLLISLSAEFFLSFLAQGSGNAAAMAKKKSVKLDHLRSAVRSHQPTSDFLLDCLPLPQRKEKHPAAVPAEKPPPPPGNRTIVDFFSKPPAVEADK